MKTNKFYVALILSPLFWCCSDETLTDDMSTPISESFSFVGVSGAPISPASRSAVVENNGEWISMPIDLMNTRTAVDANGIFGWSKDDKVGVFVHNGGELSNMQAVFQAGTPNVDNAKIATFTGVLSGLGETNTIYAVYPYSNVTSSGDAYNLPYIGLQLGGGTTNNLGKYSHMVANPTEHSVANDLTELPRLNFTQLNTMMEFKFTLSGGGTSPITRVYMSTDGATPLSGIASVDMTTASSETSTFKKLTITDPSQQVALNANITNSGDSYTAYGMILPGNHENQTMTFQAVTTDENGDNKLYSKTKTGVDFKQAHRYTFTTPLSLEDQTVSVQESNATDFTCGELMKDVRAGLPTKMYKTVEIKGVCWMAENLNVGTFKENTAPNKAAQWEFATDGVQKWCYNNDEKNCDVYGGLYEWWEVVCGGKCTEKLTADTAENLKLTESTLLSGDYGVNLVPNSSSIIQGICPDGWHLPTQSELSLLGTIKSDWSTLFAYHSANMDWQGDIGAWWTSTPGAAAGGFDGSSYYLEVKNNKDNRITQRMTNFRRANGFSVRCVKNQVAIGEELDESLWTVTNSSGSSEEAKGNIAEKLFDKNNKTFWASQKTTRPVYGKDGTIRPFVEVNLNGLYKLTGVKIHHRTDLNYDWLKLNKFQIGYKEYENDEWTTLEQMFTTGTSVSETHSNYFNGVNARFLRLEGFESHPRSTKDTGAACISTFGGYGTKLSD